MPKSLHVQYLNARDKVVSTWEHFDEQVPDNEKPRYRQLMFEYLIDMFQTWAKNGDSLPASRHLYFLARMREKVEV